MTVAATLGVVLGAVYMLSVVRRVFFGPVTHPDNREIQDMTVREMLVVGPLIVLIFLIGLFPTRMLDSMHGSVDALLDRTCPIVSQVRDPERPARCGPQVSDGVHVDAPQVAATRQGGE
ncbi:MAG: hypothetical protein QF464_13755 [Myxococcota bacterium]|jgi:NADH-quinone oxidoreductase subunit M|nr:hypothetical protein [Myxococcota bacterium]